MDTKIFIPSNNVILHVYTVKISNFPPLAKGRKKVDVDGINIYRSNIRCKPRPK